MLTIQDALTVIRKLAERSHALNAPIHDTIVVVGGTALSAHGIRAFTEDVDLYLKAFSDEAVFQLEQELKPVYGEQFRLDVTATENLWGAILLRDIAEYSPIYQIIKVAGQSLVIKMLSIEDLFLVKLGADREKDRQDLPLLAARVTAEALIARFNVVIQWHGQRPAVPRFADEFVRQLASRYGLEPAKSIPQLNLSPFIKDLLWQAYYPETDDRS
jgi:predicted nucleotidyltransferase